MSASSQSVHCSGDLEGDDSCSVTRQRNAGPCHRAAGLGTDCFVDPSVTHISNALQKDLGFVEGHTKDVDLYILDRF